MTAAQRPDVEFARYDKRTGFTRTYGHIYWRPLIVHVLGHTVIGRRRLRRMWAEHDASREEHNDGR
jgi:hypothetical protein